MRIAFFIFVAVACVSCEPVTLDVRGGDEPQIPDEPPPLPASPCEENGHMCVQMDVGVCTDGTTPFDDDCRRPGDPAPLRALCCPKIIPTECELQGAACIPMMQGCPTGSGDPGASCKAGGRPNDLTCCSPANPCVEQHFMCVSGPEFMFQCPDGFIQSTNFGCPYAPDGTTYQICCEPRR